MAIYDTTALEGETALVTGATGGIGSETARVLTEMGASVALTGRDGMALEELADEIESANLRGEVFMETADLRDNDQRKQLIEASERKIGSITLLVNAAGIGGERERFENLTPDQLEDAMHMNYTTTILLTQSVYRKMKMHKRGGIVNVSSLSGLRGTYRHIPYSGSKFALVGFTHALALEAIEHGIRVNAVCPGWVETEMAYEGIRSKARTNGMTYEEQLTEERSNIPSGQMTKPSEVANTIAFLLSDAAENIVGESIKLSGGSVLR